VTEIVTVGAYSKKRLSGTEREPKFADQKERGITWHLLPDSGRG